MNPLARNLKENKYHKELTPKRQNSPELLLPQQSAMDAATSYNTDTWETAPVRACLLHLPSRTLSTQQAIAKFWMSRRSVTVFGICRRDWRAMVG